LTRKTDERSVKQIESSLDAARLKQKQQPKDSIQNSLNVQNADKGCESDDESIRAEDAGRIEPGWSSVDVNAICQYSSPFLQLLDAVEPDQESGSMQETETQLLNQAQADRSNAFRRILQQVWITMCSFMLEVITMLAIGKRK
jgi:hypothetical protein